MSSLIIMIPDTSDVVHTMPSESDELVKIHIQAHISGQDR